MSLAITHNCYQGSHHGFNDFRHKLAEKIGIDIDKYIGYGIHGTLDLETIDHKIALLLKHSDLHLSPVHAQQIAEGLDEILGTITTGDENHDLITAIIQFRDGCKEAVSKNETIIFQ